MVSSTANSGSSLRARLLSGGAWALSAKIISSASTMLMYILLARLLSSDEMGLFFLANSVVVTLGIIGQWGLGRGLVKLVATELANNNIAKLKSAVISAFLIVAIVCMLLVLVIMSPVGELLLQTISGNTELSLLSMLIGIWILFLSLQCTVAETYRGFHDIRMASLYGGALTALLSAIAFLVIWVTGHELTVSQAAEVVLIATGVNFAVGGLFLHKRLAKYRTTAKLVMTEVARFGFPLMLTNLVLFGVLELHLWLLAYFKPESEVAMYGVALRLVLLMAVPLAVINAVIPPMVAEMYAREQYDKLQNLMQKIATLTSVPALLVFVVIIFYGDFILVMLYGAEYADAYSVFVILAVGQVVNVLTGSPGVLLTMSGQEKSVFKSALISGVAGLGVSATLVNDYSYTGSAIGYSVSIAFNNIYMMLVANSRLSIYTSASVDALIDMLTNLRAKIESDEVNGGRLSLVAPFVRRLEELWWRATGKQIIECFGDSHVIVFRYCNREKWARGCRFRTVSVKGATAYGVGNPNSKTNSLEVFKKKLNVTPSSRRLLFMMGEVDAGFLVWLRAKKNAVPAEVCMLEALDRYTTFLADVMRRHPNIMVCGIPLPTIDDGEPQGEVANARKDVAATQKERTLLSLAFNKKLKEWCRDNGVIFLDFDVYALDDDNMLVNEWLINPNVADHHYDRAAFCKLIQKVFESNDSFVL